MERVRAQDAGTTAGEGAAAGRPDAGSWRAAAAAVRPLEPGAEAPARRRLDRLTKPPGSLGRLESLAARVAALQGTDRPVSRARAVYVFAADHGVVEEGVSAYPAVVTREMIKNFINGGAAINALAAGVGAEVIVVDIGVAGEAFGAGTANFARGPAMTRASAEAALDTGARLAAEAADAGVRLAAVGDMGIGNTTATAAVAAALLGLPPERVVGPGTGLDGAGLARKRAAVAAGLARLEAGADDPVGVLAGVGGLDLAGIAGFLIGAAAARLPVVLDGVITGAAALAAARLAPAAVQGWFAGHRSVEPAHGPILEALGLKPLLDLGLRLGEGTGACLALGLVAAACDRPPDSLHGCCLLATSVMESGTGRRSGAAPSRAAAAPRLAEPSRATACVDWSTRLCGARRSASGGCGLGRAAAQAERPASHGRGEPLAVRALRLHGTMRLSVALRKSNTGRDITRPRAMPQSRSLWRWPTARSSTPTSRWRRRCRPGDPPSARPTRTKGASSAAAAACTAARRQGAVAGTHAAGAGCGAIARSPRLAGGLRLIRNITSNSSML